MIEKTFMIRTTDILALSKNKTTDEICNVLTEKLKVRLSEEFPDTDVEVGVHFVPPAMSYAVNIFIYDDHERSYKSFKDPSPADKYRDRFIKAKGKPAGLKL